jgi:hypothetical protein
MAVFKPGSIRDWPRDRGSSLARSDNSTIVKTRDAASPVRTVRSTPVNARQKRCVFSLKIFVCFGRATELRVNG